MKVTKGVLLGFFVIMLLSSCDFFELIFGIGGDEDDNRPILSVLYYAPADDPSQNLIITNFEESNPYVKLEVETLYDSAYFERLEIMTAAHDLPGAMMLWPGKRTHFVTSTALVEDIAPNLAGQEPKFIDGTLSAQGDSGELFSLPGGITISHVLYVNNTLLSNMNLTVPSTLSELLSQANTITNNGYTPIAIDNKDGWIMQSCLLSTLAARTGGDTFIIDAGKGTDTTAFSDQSFVDALSVIEDLNTGGLLPSNVTAREYGASYNEFLSDDAVYLIDGGWRVSTLMQDIDTASADSISFHIFPSLSGSYTQTGNSNSTSIVAGIGFGMKTGLSEELKIAAWNWIWNYSGPIGANIRMGNGEIVSYILEPPADAHPFLAAYKDLCTSVTAVPIIDFVLDNEGVKLLENDINSMLLGNLTPTQVAANYESWVSQNEPLRN